MLDLMSKILPKNEKKSLPQLLCTVFHNLYYWLCCDGDSNLLQALFPPIQLPLSCQVLTYVPYFLATIHYQSKTYRLTELIVTPLLPPPTAFFFGHQYLSQTVAFILLMAISLAICFFMSHGEGKNISISEIDKIFTGQ